MQTKPSPVRVLVIDHNAVRQDGRRLYAAFQSEGVAAVTIVGPRSWREFGLPLSYEEGGDGPHYVALPAYFAPRHQRVLYGGLQKVLIRVCPDIILCNAEPENFLALQVVHARRRRSVLSKIVLISWRNVDYRDVGYPYRLGAIHHRIEKHVLRSVDSIIVHSSPGRELYRRHGFADVEWIPPCVDTGAFAPAGHVNEARGADLHVGFVGRFTTLKGGEDLLRAMRETPESVSLLMVGGGEKEKGWRNMAAALGIAKRVKWHPPVPHEHMAGVLRTLDVLVLPSRTGRLWKEQFGRVLIEAMSAGVVVAGSSTGEIPVVIGKAGLLYAEGDIGQLAALLRSLAADPSLRQRCQRAGRERVEAQFSIQAVLPLYRQLFSRLAGGMRENRI
jgi:glycosyltransferase involved in cell wall biosynthesis